MTLVVSITASLLGRGELLVAHHKFHVHVVVAAPAFHGAFNQVVSLFLRSDKREVLGSFI